MPDISNVGNIAGLVGSIIALAISAIVLLTFATPIIGDMNGIFLLSTNSCGLNGERFDQVAKAASATATAEAAWHTSSPTVYRMTKNATDNKCYNDSITSGDTLFTPKGTRLTASADDLISDTATWKPASPALTALAGGSLVQLLFGAMGIMLPAGALGFLGYFGASIVRANIGGGTLAVAIGATITVVIIGNILPEVFTPLDALFYALDGARFSIFASGIGSLAGVLGNFLGVSLIGGLITLGVMLWQGRNGSTAGTSAAL